MSEKKELQVAALKNGTVIDHIPSNKLFTVVSLLGLQDEDANITIGNNFESKKLGKRESSKLPTASLRKKKSAACRWLLPKSN